jgi:alanine racemase
MQVCCAERAKKLRPITNNYFDKSVNLAIYPCALHVNTGMNRMGISTEQAESLSKEMQENSNLNLVGFEIL